MRGERNAHSPPYPDSTPAPVASGLGEVGRPHARTQRRRLGPILRAPPPLAVMGSPASGKTTLTTALSAAPGIVVFRLRDFCTAQARHDRVLAAHLRTSPDPLGWLDDQIVATVLRPQRPSAVIPATPCCHERCTDDHSQRRSLAASWPMASRSCSSPAALRRPCPGIARSPLAEAAVLAPRSWCDGCLLAQAASTATGRSQRLHEGGHRSPVRAQARGLEPPAAACAWQLLR
jgi:hypothetical protein